MSLNPYVFRLYRYINSGAAFAKSFHLFLVLLFPPLSVYSQFYQVRNFNVESGLPSSDVYSILQDSKGYIWLATDMGVSRYNGMEFSYKRQPGDHANKQAYSLARFEKTVCAKEIVELWSVYR